MYVYYPCMGITNAISGRFLVYRKGVSTSKVKAKTKVEAKTVMKERASFCLDCKMVHITELVVTVVIITKQPN